MPLDMTINLDRLRSVRLKLRRGLVSSPCVAPWGSMNVIIKKNKKNDFVRGKLQRGIGDVINAFVFPVYSFTVPASIVCIDLNEWLKLGTHCGSYL